MYRGRIAPSPTGWLHTGHARTFWTAQERCQSAGGTLVLRNEDLDAQRAREEFVAGMIEDLKWFGLAWQEGPDCGGAFAPYAQSLRFDFYRRALARLREAGRIYLCKCSRQDVLRALDAPHDGEEEPVYPGTCRLAKIDEGAERLNWRFRVPEGRKVKFTDGNLGSQAFEAGRDFGDFVVWRHDGTPSYQLAVVVDDSEMRITEVVRGADLLLSTARQILLYEALGWNVPKFFHCPLVTDESGVRLAKRHDALSLRALREKGWTPEKIRAGWGKT